MDRVFKSKIGWWYHLLLFVLVVWCVISLLHQNVFSIVVSIVSSMCALHIFFNTYYTVTADGKLQVRCGFLPQKEIAIADIEALQPSMLPVSSYALSLNRIIIWKEGQMWMLISPQQEKEFVKLLLKHNPEIEIRKQGNIQL